MCDPATIALLATTAISAGAALFGNKNKTVVNAPPPVPDSMPAIAAPTARSPGADVRVGKQTGATVKGVPSQASTFKEKRVAAVALGGLGRAGLQL